MNDDSTRFEQRSLAVGMWANLVMGAAGVTAAQLSNSDALMVDGLFSAVNFASALIAGRVAAAVMRQPDQRYPFGHEAKEALYVLFRSLVLLGILTFAGFNSLNKIVHYARGGEVPALVFGPITIYMVFMVLICFGLAAWHDLNWKKTGKRSEILKTERTASITDGFISAGAGGALLGVLLLRGTPLDFIIPVADALVVLVLALIMIGQPAGMLRSAMREVAGRAADPETIDQVRDHLGKCLAGMPCELLDVAVTKLGRFHFVVPYVKPTGSVTAEQLDAFRYELHDSYAGLFSNVRSEIIFTDEAPFEVPTS